MTYLPYINDVFQCNLTCLIDFAYKGFIIKTLFLWAFLFTSNIEVSNDLFPKNKSLKIMLICIDRADYSYRYQLQPIVLVIGPITRIADVSLQLYLQTQLERC